MDTTRRSREERMKEKHLQLLFYLQQMLQDKPNNTDDLSLRARIKAYKLAAAINNLYEYWLCNIRSF